MKPASLTDVTESNGCNGSIKKETAFLRNFRCIRCFLFLSVLAVPAFSQVPGVINYQGSLRDKSGNPINQSLPMTFSIYDTPATGTGTQLWTENQTVGVNNGVFSVHVGAVNPIPESVFASSSAYLEVDINGEAPSARPQLLSSPYSFHSSAADYALTVSSSIAVSTINATASTPFGGVNITTNAFIQGNVGIGTTSPGATLDVNGVIESNTSDLWNTAGNYAGLQFFDSSSLTTREGVIETQFGNHMDVKTDTTIPLYLGTDATVRMTISPAGYVGIGTTSPGAVLTVIANSPVASTNEGSQSMLDITTGVSGQSLYMSYDGTNNVGFIEASESGSVEPLILQPRGNDVGIGTANPGYVLTVFTPTANSPAGFVNSNGTCIITPTNTTLSCTSDIRLKKDIHPIADGLEAIVNLKPITFRWKKSDDGISHPGFSAQDVEKVIPQAVSTDKSGYKTLSQITIIPFLVKAIQEQQREIKNLKSTICAENPQARLCAGK